MAKAKDAFRTISEVAEWLDTPTHVLRFWESKFSQIKPVKGAGGRRYYRPADMDLLGGIKQLLHEEGMTIKGTQKLLREKGVKHVAGLGLSMTAPAAPVAVAEEAPEQAPAPEPTPVEEAPAPAPEADDPVQNAFMFEHKAPAESTPAEEPAQAAPEVALDLPALPDGLPDLSARSFGLIAARRDGLKTKAAEIAPIVKELQALRDKLQQR
ncbi:MerR family transcriptional regulator [Yoonia sp. SS1-5]|uniref:MerR family transcriptional regulator n=1 Tax=Yoonia rhodophyticola TaxID=3137370 RepID=A0AAN0MAY0_9RHOB